MLSFAVLNHSKIKVFGVFGWCYKKGILGMRLSERSIAERLTPAWEILWDSSFGWKFSALAVFYEIFDGLEFLIVTKT